MIILPTARPAAGPARAPFHHRLAIAGDDCAPASPLRSAL